MCLHLIACLLAVQLAASTNSPAGTQEAGTAAQIQWSTRPPDLSHMTLADLKTELTSLEDTKGNRNPDLVPVLWAIARAYQEKGAYVTGLPFAQRALNIARQVHGEYAPEAVLSQDLVGELDLLSGNTEAAIETEQSAQSIVEKYLGTGAPIQAVLLLHLGIAYLEAGRLEDAGKALNKASHALASAFGPETLEATSAQVALGELYLERGRYSKAEKKLESALAVRLITLSELLDDADEPEVRLNIGRVQVPLGALYTVLGRYDEANHCLLGALQAYEARLGKSHPALEEVLVNLAALAAVEGDRAAADGYRKRAEKIHEEYLGISHLAGVPLPEPLKPQSSRSAVR